MGRKKTDDRELVEHMIKEAELHGMSDAVKISRHQSTKFRHMISMHNHDLPKQDKISFKYSPDQGLGYAYIGDDPVNSLMLVLQPELKLMVQGMMIGFGRKIAINEEEYRRINSFLNNRFLDPLKGAVKNEEVKNGAPVDNN